MLFRSGIVGDIPICSSAHYFILPEEELSVLYPEISDFASYVNIHTREDGKELRRAVFGAVSDERVAISGLEDTITVLESGMKGGAEKGLYRLRRQTNFARSSDIEPKEGNEYDMAF